MLTSREREVLDLRAAGMSRKEIAARLGVSVHTVRGHISNTYVKLGVDNLIDALRAVGRLA